MLIGNIGLNVSNDLLFRFHGVSVEIRLKSSELRERLLNDFQYFQCGDLLAQPDFCIEQVDEVCWPAGKYRILRKGQKLLRAKPITYVDYDGAILKADFKSGRFWLSGIDIHRLHETAYLLVLSVIGKKLDLKGLHKMHAFAATQSGRVVVGIGRSGSGKSTILRWLLRRGYKMISDDIPLFDLSHIRPMPLRLATSDNVECDFTLKRRLYGEKKLIGIRGIPIADRKPVRDCHFVFLTPRTHDRPSLTKCSKGLFFAYLFKYMVIGVGTPMILELFWLPGVFDFFKKFRIFLSRLFLAVVIVRHNDCWQFKMTQDVSQNGEALVSWLSKGGATDR